MESRLTKGILYVFIANMLNMLFSLVTNFVLPKFLPVDSYAAIKTFQLYVTYVGAFHLGFVDGIYLKYGGKELYELNLEEINESLSTIRIFQLLITAIMSIISVVIHDKILLAFSMAILPLNMTSYFKMLYQAIGEFKLYGRITNYTTGLTFAVNLILLFVLDSKDYCFYLLCYVIVDFLIWIVLEVLFSHRSHIRNSSFVFSIEELVSNIKSGISLMCGNFASFVLTGLDRWFVKFTMDTIAFAQYSFAVSIENMLNLVITPVTVPLYNYFCKERDIGKIKLAHKIVIVFAGIIVSSAFLVEIAVKLFLDSYVSAVKVVYLLFAAQAFQIIIKAIYVNLYKVRFQQSRYFIKLIIVILSGILFNIICYNILKSKEAYAWGTLFSSILWFLISVPDFIELFDRGKELFYIGLEIVVFLISGLVIGGIIGLLIYFLCTLILSLIFMHDCIINVAQIAKKYL